MATIDMSYAKEKLVKWAEQSGKNVDELADKFSEILKTKEGKTESSKIRKALSSLKSEIEVNFSSKAVTYKVVILGKSPARDVREKKLKELRERYLKDAAGMLSNQEVTLDEETKEPIFMDMTKNYGDYPNNNYMKPLAKHLWMSSLQLAVIKPNEDQDWQPGFLKLTDQMALSNDIPIGSELTIRANGSFNKAAGRYELKQSTTTEFVNSKSLTTKEITEVWETVYGDSFVLVEDLQDHFDSENKKDYERFVIIEGTANFVKPPTDDVSGQIGLGSSDLEFGERLTVFCDRSILPMINKIKNKDNLLVFGRIGPSKKYVDGHKTDEDTVLINAYSVYVQEE